MNKYTFTITAETKHNLTTNDVHSALDEIITDGQSLARQVADDAEATDRSRLEAEHAHSLDISIEPVNHDFNASERLLRDERDSWFQVGRNIQNDMNAAHAAGQVKKVRCLGAALAFAYASRDAADDLLTEMMKLKA